MCLLAGARRIISCPEGSRSVSCCYRIYPTRTAVYIPLKYSFRIRKYICFFLEVVGEPKILFVPRRTVDLVKIVLDEMVITRFGSLSCDLLTFVIGESKKSFLKGLVKWKIIKFVIVYTDPNGVSLPYESKISLIGGKFVRVDSQLRLISWCIYATTRRKMCCTS